MEYQDYTLPTGMGGMGKSKSNLVYKPSLLPPDPQATAESPPPTPCATSPVRGFSPQHPELKVPQTPLTRAPWIVEEPPTPGTKALGLTLYRPFRAAGGPSGKAGDRERARATSPDSTPPARRPFPGDAPERGPTTRLRRFRGGCSTGLRGGRCPAAAGP